MIIERQDRQREKETAYRQQLLKQIENKKNYRNRPQRDNDQSRPPQEFGLIKNIEAQQQARNNKKQQYLAEFKQQMENERGRKKRQKDQRLRQEMLEEQKIKRENQILRSRYQEEMKKERRKKQPESTPVQQERPPQTNNAQRQRNKIHTENGQNIHNGQNIYNSPNVYNEHEQQRNYPIDSLDRMGAHSKYQQRVLSQQSFEPIQPRAYSNRPENDEINFAIRPRPIYKESYFRQILGHKRVLEQQAASISQFNRLLTKEKYRKKENFSNGGNLQQLRKLGAFLEEKESHYQKPLNRNSYLPANNTHSNSTQYERGNYFGNSRTDKRDSVLSAGQDRVNEDKWYRLD